MGTVVVSIDAELGWGFHDRQSPPIHRIEAAREGWRSLLDLLDRYGIPATWAVVGHLFLDDCDGVHADHPAGEEWFERERGAWADRPEFRYAPDLVRAVADADADHDIGCHTFSHVEFDHPSTTADVARAELATALEIAEDADVDSAMDSFIFPRNKVGHRDVLAELGFTCYRGLSTGANVPGLSTVRKVTQATIGSPPLVDPTVDRYGLVNVPPSLFLYGFEGVARSVCQRVWDDPVASAARHGIDAAVDADGVFHMWLHPNNLVTQADVDRLQTIFAYAARRREESNLRVETMRDVARRVGTEPEAATPHN